MSAYFFAVSIPPGFRSTQVTIGGRPLAAFADGSVADTAETVTPQAGIVGAEPDRDDRHTMGHG